MRFLFIKKSDFPGNEGSGKVLVFADGVDLQSDPPPVHIRYFLLEDLDPAVVSGLDAEAMNRWVDRVLPENISIMDIAPLLVAMRSGQLQTVDQVLAALNATEFTA